MFNRWLSCQLRTCWKSIIIAIAAALSTSNCCKSVIIAIATGLLTTICSKSVVIAIATGLLTTICSKFVVIAIATDLSTSNCNKSVVVLMRAFPELIYRSWKIIKRTHTEITQNYLLQNVIRYFKSTYVTFGYKVPTSIINYSKIT